MHRITSYETADETGQRRQTWSFARHEHANEAWHGLGQVVPAVFAEDIGYWREAAGLGYRFEMSLLLDAETGQPATYDSGYDDSITPRTMTYGRPLRIWEIGPRAGEREPGGIAVSMGTYEPTDPEMMFDEVLTVRTTAIEAGLVNPEDCFIDCAGSLRQNNRQFVTLHLPTVDAGGDRIETWLSRVSSCDSSAANSSNFGSLRVVCDNTTQIQLWLTKALAGGKANTDGWKLTGRGAEGGARFAHRSGGNRRMGQALSEFARALGFGADIAEVVDRLSALRVTDRTFRAICEDVWPSNKPTDPDAKLLGGPARQARIHADRVDVLEQQWAIETKDRGLGKTGWAALQPITYVLSRQQAGGDVLTEDGQFEIRAFANTDGNGKRGQRLTETAIDSILARGVR